jgi:hypothetical protein
MVNDDADQAGDSEEDHKAEGRVHDGQRNQRPDGTVRGGSGDEDWLHCIVELDEKCAVDTNERDSQGGGKIFALATAYKKVTNWHVRYPHLSESSISSVA